MKSKILAAIVIVAILLIGVFLLAPNAFVGIVPDEYIPGNDTSVSSAEIHWQNKSSGTTSTVSENSDII